MKGRVCVTGGTGFLGSWIVKKLLEDGYSVNTTTRIHTEGKRDISYLRDLPHASERLQIFDADLDEPESFGPAIEGCMGVFHVAHPLDLQEQETEQVKTKRVMNGLQGILQACADSKTVKRVVYTSSISAAAFSGGEIGPGGLIDESCWTDVDMIGRWGAIGGQYIVTKTLAERAALDFAEKLGLDLVTLLPTCTTGPFLCSHLPDSVRLSMALFLGEKGNYGRIESTSLVHVDDVARAHIHVFEYEGAKGRYICSALDTTIDELCEFISARYPEYQMPAADSWKDTAPVKLTGFSTKKLLETGFEYEKGLEEMFDGAFKCCKEKGFL
ncbi:vestitone reductase [Phtheirospermum japonicum]|uniref:Dihydroflavonol 4-reductase n=1 Tax=Phtheirospermum japonicum TaxID=374723 RepID=A0A830DDP1_9LAMI|nr:vestitone reductase [Phtheirospermum japonicum]